MTKRNIRLTGNFSQWNSKRDHQGIKGKKELHLEQIFRAWHLHWPVYISASLHVVQCSYNNIHAGEKGVVVDALGSRTHLVEMSFHLQVWVDIAGCFCSCCTLWFLHHKKKLYIIKDSALERQGHKKAGIRNCSSFHLYMVWSEEKLTVEIGLFYKIWICDAHLSIGRCRIKNCLLPNMPLLN